MANAPVEEGAEQTATTEDTLPTLRFRLPGSWWQIPLHDHESARVSIRNLLRLQVGETDELANFREKLRREFLASLETAIQGEGQDMYVALNVVEGTPISASLSVFLPAVRITPSIGASGAAVMDVFRRGIEEAALEGVDTLTTFENRESHVLRTNKRSSIRATTTDDELPVLVVDYWLTIPGFKRVVLLSFSTVFTEIEEVMITFFDSIVRATYWEHPAT